MTIRSANSHRGVLCERINILYAVVSLHTAALQQRFQIGSDCFIVDSLYNIKIAQKSHSDILLVQNIMLNGHSLYCNRDKNIFNLN